MIVIDPTDSIPSFPFELSSARGKTVEIKKRSFKCTLNLVPTFRDVYLQTYSVEIKRTSLCINRTSSDM